MCRIFFFFLRRQIYSPKSALERIKLKSSL